MTWGERYVASTFCKDPIKQRGRELKRGGKIIQKNKRELKRIKEKEKEYKRIKES